MIPGNSGAGTPAAPVPSAAVVGLGLIGGSLALGLRRAGVARVVGVDVSPDAAAQAMARGAVEEAGTDLALVRGADVVLVAVPTARIVPAVAALAAHVGRGVVVSDAGSVKGPIVEGAAAVAPGLRFVGGHPMAGSERQGIGAADAALLDGRPYVLTPTAGTERDALDTMLSVVAALRMRPVVLPPDAHDRIVAQVSHLPYLVSVALVQMVADDALAVAGPAFRDATRVAASPPAMWEEICALNRVAVLEALDRFSAVVAEIREMVTAGAPLGETLRRARERRGRL